MFANNLLESISCACIMVLFDEGADPPLFMQATASSSQHARVSIGKTRVSANIVSPRKVSIVVMLNQFE